MHGGFLGTLIFGSKMGVGVEKMTKKVKKRRKNEKKVKKSGKIEKKAKKCPVLLCKFVKNSTPDTKTTFNVKIGNF